MPAGPPGRRTAWPERAAPPFPACGAEAKRTTARLLTDLGWPSSSQLDMGDITTARGQEHFALLFMGIASGLGAHTFNINVVTRPTA